MGIQIHSGPEYRTAVKLIHDGAIGKVTAVHSWAGAKWSDAGPMPDAGDPVPEGLNWDLWLGVAAERPFIGNGWYHPGQWRKRLDFGTGSLGDMACHIFDPVFSALRLTAPISVRSEGAAPNEHSWAPNAEIHYVFPGTEFTEGKTVEVTWYDGDARPPDEIRAFAEGGTSPSGKPLKVPATGSVFLGTEGVLVLPHVGMPRLVGDGGGDWEIEQVKGANHWHQFIDAALGEGKATANFDYAGPLTEAVLVGSVAARFPKATLEWNPAKLAFTNEPAANKFIRREYRKGWETPGL
jgi:predicted dehydrogenase